ncbi:MAG: SDR family oxidoreductase [Actinobacteria bacterium]|nr:SDR family oxidoreductase [Actinomycetota bacterium]
MQDERVAVVTGGGRGMGRAIARAYAERGTRVVVASRTVAELEETAAASDLITAFACDAAEPDQVEALFEFVRAEHGRVDALVCCQGVYQGGVRAFDLPLEQWDHTMAVNLRGVWLCAQAAGRLMRDGGRGGRMVFISSMNGLASQTYAVDYDVSKAAVNGLARALAVEFAPEKITVNAIAPGWIRTEMSAAELAELESEGLVMNPLGEVGTPEQIALATLWLTDPGNGFVTGTVVTVDGGQTAMLPLPWNPAASVAPGAPGAG